MIVRGPMRWFELLFAWNGSVFSKIWRRVAFVTLVSVVETWAHQAGHFELTLTPLPFTLIGLALSIFLGFRNNTSYDRFWEGRKLWGRLVNTSRSLTRQILTLVVVQPGEAPVITDTHRELVHRLVAYVHLLRLHLRGLNDLSELQPLLDADELAALQKESNRPIALIQGLGDRLHSAWRKGWIDTLHLPVLEQSLTDLADIQGGCERIRSTPIPLGYTVLMHRIVGVYCVTLPFGIEGQVGVLTPLVVLLISYAFLGLDALGDEIEDPFGTDANDLPLDQLSTMIEINLRERLGEADLPQAVRPVKGRLT